MLTHFTTTPLLSCDLITQLSIMFNSQFFHFFYDTRSFGSEDVKRNIMRKAIAHSFCIFQFQFYCFSVQVGSI